ncbi:ABC transporter substrate-binding protein [Paenibacillus sp. FA6]|uniref:ABC transporter substrate-binding protein n=1 Tax=Paenibacillus sp. FA6 TaxID=3413029 RepID=UPI003F657FF6
MMNRRLVLMMCMVVLFSLLFIGCESVQTTETSVPPSDTGNSEISIQDNESVELIESLYSSEPIRLGFSQLGSESDWRRANTNSVKESAKEAGITLLFENAEQSQEKQFEAIRSFIQQKVDVIAIAPVVQSGWEPILLEVKQAGIPVIIADRSVNVSDPSLYVTFIGSDFYDEGRKAGKYLLDKMREKPGPIGIVELQGTMDSTPTIERKNGFREIITSRPDFKILKSKSANFTLEEGKEVMQSIIEEQGKDIDVLFSHNDDMALGAIEAIEAAGLRPGIDIIIISVDGTRKSFEMMVEGKINAVVECNPLLGMNLMQAVQEIIGGKNLPKRIVLPESIYTQAVAEREVNNRKY